MKQANKQKKTVPALVLGGYLHLAGVRMRDVLTIVMRRGANEASHLGSPDGDLAKVEYLYTGPRFLFPSSLSYI